MQLSQSVSTIKEQSSEESALIDLQQTELIDDSPIDPQDRALFHLRQGDIFALRGNWADAEWEYQRSVELNGGLPSLRKLAQAQLQRRDNKGVNQTLKKMKAEGARSEDMLLLESIIELRIGELVKARGILENAEDSPQKHYGLSLLYIVEGNHELALQELDTVINGWDPVLRSYARTLKAAYNEYTLFPESPNIHLITLISRALAQVQECELAIPLLIQVTQTKDDYRDAWIVQGYCELITERPQQALASLERAYALDPQKPEIQYFLARSHSALDEHENAITFFEYALENGFDPPSEVQRLIAEEALEIGNSGLALDQYEALTEAANTSIEFFEGYIETSINIGKTDEAYEKAQDAVKRWPKDAIAHYLFGWAALEKEEEDEAREALEKALEINPYLTSAKEKMKEL